MGMPLKELLQLPELKNSRMLAGENGLSRVVRWVHVMNVLEKKNWVQGGELVLFARQDVPLSADAFHGLVVSVAEKHASGLGFHAGSFIGEMLDSTKQLVREKQMLLFEISAMQSLSQIAQAICTTIVIDAEAEKPLLQLMEDILFQENQQIDSISHRASRLGYRLDLPSRVLIFEIDKLTHSEKDDRLAENMQAMGVKNTIQKMVTSAFMKNDGSAMSMVYGESIILLLMDAQGSSQKDEKALKSSVAALQKKIGEALPGITVSVGMGGVYQDIPGMKKSYKEAAFAMRVQRADGKTGGFISHRDLGINRLLFKVWDPEDLREFVTETLGELLNYDARSKTEFTSTLQAYMLENGNLVRTAQQLNTHRNTLKYRVQRIQEILECDLQDADTRLNIQVALAICRYLNIG